MKLYKPIILTDSIEIRTTPEKIWDFSINLEKNYHQIKEEGKNLKKSLESL